MKIIAVATRRYAKETYTFNVSVPEYAGEIGCLGVEISPYITVTTPENAFGYTDTFFYNADSNDGYFEWRYHPEWIKRKIIDVIHRNYANWMETFTANIPTYEEHVAEVKRYRTMMMK